MRRLLTELGAAVIIFAFALNLHAQGGCDYSGCTEGDPGVECSLDIHDCYPDADCNAPNCPGFKCADLYQCTQFGWPCGTKTCTYCTGCAFASGSCPQEKGKTHAKAILAAVRARARQRAS